jgi:hypothetical protein
LVHHHQKPTTSTADGLRHPGTTIGTYGVRYALVNEPDHPGGTFFMVDIAQSRIVHPGYTDMHVPLGFAVAGLYGSVFVDPNPKEFVSFGRIRRERSDLDYGFGCRHCCKIYKIL